MGVSLRIKSIKRLIREASKDLTPELKEEIISQEKDKLGSEGKKKPKKP